MSIEEEITSVAINVTAPPSAAWSALQGSEHHREYVRRLSLALMPLVKHAQAEAWEEGFDAAEADWTHHKDAGWGDEDCIDATFNPYAENEGAGAHD